MGRKIPAAIIQQTIIVLAVIALYASTLTFGYVLDDKIVITDNQFVQKGFAGIKDILTKEGFVGYFGEKRELVIGSRYRPLSLVMFAVEHSLAPNKPWLGHLVNVLLYAILGLVLFRWASFTFHNRSYSKWWLSLPFLIGLLYVLHPIHIEAVANIKGRDEILAMLLSMLTLLWSQKYARTASIKWLPVVGVTYFLAMLAKENSITFFFVVPFTLWAISKASWKHIGLILFAMGLGLCGYLAMRAQAVGYVLPKAPAVTGDLMNNPFLGMEASEQWSTITYTMGKYLQLLIFPHPLTHDYYPYHIPRVGWDNAFVLITIIAYILIAVLAALTWKKNRWITWSLLFFIATISVVSNIPFTVGTFMNERFAFMPSLGFSVLTSMMIVSLTAKDKFKMMGMALLAIFIGGYLLKTITRMPDWESGYTLNVSAVKVSRNSARINLFMGTDYFNMATAENEITRKRSLLNQAMKHLERSKGIYRTYASANNMITGVCAEFFKDDRDINKLLECFGDVAVDMPNTTYLNQFLDYLKGNGDYTPELARYYENVGYEKLYLERNNYIDAIRYLKEAEALNPGSRQLYERMSAVYLAFGFHLQDYPDPNYKTADVIETGRMYGNKARGE